ncbi:hypothetical protein QNH20_08310 [Neobacillus sp. WH10]|nr:hypothetical protein [Neobacillus sp. WH10]WHY79119.1 hypothetical protein QNH20_08310 [Neobacillus sp. WH10]
MGSRRKTLPRIPVEEISVEIGDVNGVKLYETKKKNKNKSRKEK